MRLKWVNVWKGLAHSVLCACLLVLLLLDIMCWILPPKGSYVGVLTPSTMECDLIWKQGCCSCNQVTWNHTGVGGIWTQTDMPSGEHPERMKSETGMMLLLAEEWQGFPANHRKLGESCGTDPPPPHKGLRRNQLCWHLNLEFPASRTVRWYISVV